MQSGWRFFLTAALASGVLALTPGAADAAAPNIGSAGRSVQAAQTTRAAPSGRAGGTSQASQSAQAGSQAQTGGQPEIAGQITGDERFLRENRDPGQMVGGAGQGIGSLRGQTDNVTQPSMGMGRTQGGFNQGGFNPMNAFGGGMNNPAMFNAMSRQRRALRVPLRLGPAGTSFSGPAPGPAVASGPNLRVQQSLARIPQLRGASSLSVEMQGQVAVLKGVVTSQHERDLVARLVLLEPGVGDVKNELQVGSTETPTPVPAPTPVPTPTPQPGLAPPATP